jgi:hypothetical protein
MGEWLKLDARQTWQVDKPTPRRQHFEREHIFLNFLSPLQSLIPTFKKQARFDGF